jgi:hypothetical protein
MNMFYSVRNKPLYDEYVFIIYSAQMEVLTYENVLVTFNKYITEGLKYIRIKFNRKEPRH